MKLCIDCKHYRAPKSALDPIEFSRCEHPRLISPVTGTLRASYCNTQREFESETFCSKDARFFESATVPTLQAPSEPTVDDLARLGRIPNFTPLKLSDFR